MEFIRATCFGCEPGGRVRAEDPRDDARATWHSLAPVGVLATSSSTCNSAKRASVLKGWQRAAAGWCWRD